MGQLEYTVAEIEAKIKRYDDRIDTLLFTASQQGADGVYASFAGKINELQRERAIWEERLTVARRREGEFIDPPSGTLAGPEFKLE